MEPNYNPYTNSPNGENQNPYGQPQQFPSRAQRAAQSFETAAFTLGIISVFSSSIIYVAYICGALAILFALLSRGDRMHFSSHSRLGLIFGVGAIILSTVLFVYSLYTILQEYGSIENYLREYSTMLGIDFEEEFGYLFEQIY